MNKIIIIFCFPFILFGNNIKQIDKRIILNKTLLKINEQEKKQTELYIQNLATAIEKEQKLLETIERRKIRLGNEIISSQLKLVKIKKTKDSLSKRSSKLAIEISELEKNLVDKIVDNYTLTVSKKILDKQNSKDVVNDEKFKLLSTNIKEYILHTNINYFKLFNEQNQNEKKLKKLNTYIEIQAKEQKKLQSLEFRQKKSIEKLRLKHKEYKNELRRLVDNQFRVRNLLNSLNIVKETEAEKNRKKQILAKQDEQKKLIQKEEKKLASKNVQILSKNLLDEELDTEVKNLGDSTRGIKVSKYKGVRLAPPLEKFDIVKDFGDYYDPVYKIKFFNESISLQSKIDDAKVYASLKGKVVYAKKNAGTLGNVVILQHANNLHTIYSQLSDIPKTIKVGKFVPQGYTVGRVNNTLIYQVTKDNKYINPKELF